ncbi:hypothetical protein ACWIUD_09740 [Helicobacter sp. 23-1044]
MWFWIDLRFVDCNAWALPRLAMTKITMLDSANFLTKFVESEMDCHENSHSLILSQ